MFVPIWDPNSGIWLVKLPQKCQNNKQRISYLSGSSECNFINVHMFRDSSTSSRTIARDNVDYASREASL